LSKQTAHEVCVTGKRYGGDSALQRGIVEEIATEGEVLPKAIALAKSLAGKHRATLQAIKRGAYANVIACLEAERGKLAPISGNA
jgi:enoyl-CoA hydratase/carnithine racemase